jgi:hypothetical protein
VVSKWVLAVGVRSWFLSIGCSTQGSLSVFMTWVAYPRKSNPREQKRSVNDTPGLILEVTHCHFYSIILTTHVCTIQDHTEAPIPEVKDHQEPFWRLASIAPVFQTPFHLHVLSILLLKVCLKLKNFCSFLWPLSKSQTLGALNSDSLQPGILLFHSGHSSM